jgi:hypothetical protein
VADGPDVRALRHLLDSFWGKCLDCPFSGPVPFRGPVTNCSLLGRDVNHGHPPCTAEDWQERARIELATLGADNALLAAVAHDAREESLMYRRGLAEGAAAEREACCKDVCADCAAGRPVAHDFGGWWHPGTAATTGPLCRANGIRRRSDGDGR